MGWDLEADIDYIGNPISLISSLIEFFSADLSGVRVYTTRGVWPIEDISRIKLNIGDDLLNNINKEIEKYKADDVASQIQLCLNESDPNYTPLPEFYILGDGLEGATNRRRSPVVLGFGNRNAWRGNSVLENSRRKVDESLVMSALKHLCLQVRPKSLYLVNEEQASIPFNDHFVYHSDISGFNTDLKDITRLFLHGGKGFYSDADARSRYKPIASGQEPMLFCKRSDLHRDRLREYLVMRLPQIDASDELKIDTDIVESALLESDDELDYFFDSNGLGIFSKPFLKSYVEAFYIELIDALTE